MMALVATSATATACSDPSSERATSSIVPLPRAASTSGPGASAAPASSAAARAASSSHRAFAFEAKLVAPPSVAAGERASIEVVLEALGDHHINADYPLRFSLGSPSAGLRYPEPVVRDAVRTERRATLTVPFEAAKPGVATITGTLALSVCNDASCVIDKVELAATVEVR
jgi:hypothetical protein